MAKDSGLQIDERDRVIVSCGDSRKHSISVEDTGEQLYLSGIVTQRAAAVQSGATPLSLWATNRFRELVGFKFDARGRIVGAATVPSAGLTVDEFKFVVETLGRACDQMEAALTGRDVE